MVDQKPVWWEVAKVSDVIASDPLEVAVGPMAIILIRLADGIVAYQGTCPHQSALLGGGSVIDGWLRCPQHRAMFRLADGVCGKGWELPALRRYALRIDAGAIFLSDPPTIMD
jgi:3-phenylpropionate/trans-cinnamate dioxygenase ferredoxin subunit